MRFIHLKICLIFISNLVLLPLSAQSLVHIPDSIAQKNAYNGEDFYDISLQCNILRDSSQKITWAKLQQNPNGYAFTPNNTHTKPLGHFENCWAKFVLQSPIEQEYFIMIPTTFNADCYQIFPDGKILTQKTGYQLLPSQKSVKGFRKHFFKISLKAKQPVTLFILFKTTYRAFFNSEVILSLHPAQTYANSTYVNRRAKSHEIFLAIWFMLMFYNGLLYLIIKEKLYLIYVFYILTWVGFNEATFHLLAMRFSESSLVPFWRISTYLYGVCLVMFLQHYLKVSKYSPHFSRYNRNFLLFLLWLPLYALIDILIRPHIIPPSAFTKSFYDVTMQIVQVLILITAVSPLLFVYEAIVIYRKGYKPASWYIAGSSVLLFSISGYYLFNYIFKLNHLNVWLADFLLISQHAGFTIEMVIFSVGIGYRFNRAQKETQVLLENQNISLEEQVRVRTHQLRQANLEIASHRDHLIAQNKEIMDSINYAQYIQEAFLPPIEHIQTFFPESFIFFQPKEKVSGDFYWFAQVKPKVSQIINKVYGEMDHPTDNQLQNPKIIMAVVDCTGHGVAGALMSMVGNDALNKIVLEKGIVEADKILNLLHLNIRQLVYRQDVRGSVGMDISLVVIDQTAQTMEFAGGLHSMVIFQNNECKLVKGDLLSIGGVQRGIARKFTKHVFSIEHPTTFYLFSDGYRDQFGGERGKKLGAKRFYELIKKIWNKPMIEQKDVFTEEINKWMQDNYEQLDDMLLMGIRTNI